jgi:hypothetical protein
MVLAKQQSSAVITPLHTQKWPDRNQKLSGILPLISKWTAASYTFVSADRTPTSDAGSQRGR